MLPAPLLSAAAAAVPPPCNITQHSSQYCADFCSGRCGFYNTSEGDTGVPLNISMYRITPNNVTGIRNKDTGDAPGDAGYFLSKKGAIKDCVHDPTASECISLDPTDLYGQFKVEIDGQYGPYLQCNPAGVGHKPGTQYDPAWSDTRDFVCGQSCMHPSYEGCGGSQHYNGTGYMGVNCYCGGARPRNDLTVGRVSRVQSSDYEPGPDKWAPQCHTHYYPPSDKRVFAPVANWTVGMQIWVRSQSGNAHQCTVLEVYVDKEKCAGRDNPDAAAVLFRYNGYTSEDRVFVDSDRIIGVQVGPAVPQCYNGTTYATVTGWSVASATAMACERCSADPDCTGWATDDNRTVRLFAGDVQAVDGACASAHWYKGNSYNNQWYGVSEIGGYWFSTPVAGECAPGQPLGTDGCTWRTVETVKYAQAQCINDKVDSAVERYHAECFGGCPAPLNRTSDCYIDCYHDALVGNAAINLTRMEAAQLVGPWQQGFDSDDPSDGGCPRVAPAPCDGAQCPPA